jgi:PAS domain S-box-containing protein
VLSLASTFGHPTRGTICRKGDTNMSPLVTPQLQHVFDTMPGSWGCKDENSAFLYVNDALAAIAGFDSKHDAIGMTDHDLPCDAAACAHLFRAQDKEVMEKERSLRILDIHPCAKGEWRAFIFSKMPLRNEDGDIAGTIFHGEEISEKTTLELGNILVSVTLPNLNNHSLVSGTSYIISCTCEQPQLTPREAEVLFLLLRCRTPKQISAVLNISVRTVERHIDHLKHKFGAGSKSELLDRSLELGFLNQIPESLYKQQLSMILRLE